MEDMDIDRVAKEIAGILKELNTIKTQFENGSVSTRPQFTGVPTAETVKTWLEKLESEHSSLSDNEKNSLRKVLEISTLSEYSRAYCWLVLR